MAEAVAYRNFLKVRLGLVAGGIINNNVAPPATFKTCYGKSLTQQCRPFCKEKRLLNKLELEEASGLTGCPVAEPVTGAPDDDRTKMQSRASGSSRSPFRSTWEDGKSKPWDLSNIRTVSSYLNYLRAIGYFKLFQDICQTLRDNCLIDEIRYFKLQRQDCWISPGRWPHVTSTSYRRCLDVQAVRWGVWQFVKPVREERRLKTEWIQFFKGLLHMGHWFIDQCNEFSTEYIGYILTDLHHLPYACFMSRWYIINLKVEAFKTTVFDTIWCRQQKLEVLPSWIFG